jgi:uncharacterized membrane protein YvbJ
MKDVRKKIMEMDTLQIIFLVGLLLLVLIIPSFLKYVNSSDSSNEYYRSAIVTDIKDNIAYLEDTTGNVWTIEKENVQLYGRYILTMSDNNTDTIYDDEIIKIE